ncbi:MAG: nitroreductase [Paenibacillus sp.]|nr:nitroreductase [Paenibacillus sp.]
MKVMHEQQSYTSYPIAELIRNRRTVRSFRSDPVSHELLMELLDIANWAPNHGSREPWRYILYRGASRTAFAEAVLGAMSAEEKDKYAEQRLNDYGRIPLHLIVVMKEDPRQKQWDEDYGAVCCWIQNFQLAAWERGIGVVWKTNSGFCISATRRRCRSLEPGRPPHCGSTYANSRLIPFQRHDGANGILLPIR